jgi:hypothetical protein
MIRVVAFLLFISMVYPISAHHGTTGQFDQSKSLRVTGVVTKIRFVNPHSYVYFDAVNTAGKIEEWRCEMRAATVLKRSGWTKDMFAPGTRITIDGVPAHREPTGCYVNNVTFDDGTTIYRYQQLTEKGDDLATGKRLARLANGKPNLNGDWAAPQRLITEADVRSRAMGAGMGGGRSRYAQTEAGIQASAGHEREDNPRFHCQATNIIQDWTFDQHINRISQTDDSITLQYGFMNIVRTIHLKKGEHTQNIQPSRAGHSVGHWDGDTLVVDTIGFEEGYLDGRNGIKHSNQLHIVERFTMNPNDNSLSRSYTGSDPIYLTSAFQGDDKIFLTQTPFDPYNCEDLTEEIVGGF